MEEIKISKEKVLKAYKVACNLGDENSAMILEELFGAEIFQPKNIMERVKTFEDAVRELGETHPLVRTYIHLESINDRNLLAHAKLWIIVAALNEGWIPPQDCKTNVWQCLHGLYTKEELDNMSDEEKATRHMLDITGKYCSSSCGFGFMFANAYPLGTMTVDSHLCFKTQELAEYCGRQFIELWAEFRLI